VLFAAAALLGVATFVLYWTMSDNASFSDHPKRMGVMVASGVLAVCCAVAGILAAQRAPRGRLSED
jgi:hypothetical protein